MKAASGVRERTAPCGRAGFTWSKEEAEFIKKNSPVRRNLSVVCCDGSR